MRFAFFVIHSCPYGLPGGGNVGGMNVYVRELAAYLGRRGHTIDIYTRAHAGHDTTPVAIARNVRLIHLADGNTTDAGKLAIWESLPVFVRHLEEFYRTNNLQYDIIFSHYWISGAAGLTLQTQWQIPHMTMFHTLGAVKNTLPTAENEPGMRVTVETRIMRTVDRIIAATTAEKKFLEQEFGINAEKVAVNPCVANTRVFRILHKAACRQQLNIPTEAKCVLFVGRLEKIKGIDRLLEAAALMKHTPHLKFFILGGDKNDRSKLAVLQSQTAAAGISDIVIFHPAVPQHKLQVWYNAADILALPSYAESFGMTALEALTCGTPVVASPVGSMPDLIQNGVNGIMTADNTPANIAGALQQVLRQYRNYKPSAIRNTVAAYDWEKIGQQIVTACAQLVGES